MNDSDVEGAGANPPPPPPSLKLKSLTKDRQYVRANITRLHNIINQQELTAEKKSQYLEKLVHLKSRIQILNDEINSLSNFDGDEFEDIMEQEEHYDEMLARAMSELTMYDADNSGVPDGGSRESQNMIRLPNITLPVFSNLKNESYEQFVYAFESIMDKHRLSDYEKFVYLKGQLRNEPYELICSLEHNEQTYDCARELLGEAYGSLIVQKGEVIGKLVSLKLGLGDNVDRYIASMRNILNSIKILEISMEDILQYFIWESLNDSFQNQLIQISNNENPELDEIKDNIWVAARRYKRLINQSDFKKPKVNANDSYKFRKEPVEPIRTNNLAVKIQSEKPVYYCVLCVADGKKNVSHILRECKRYETPFSKVTKLNFYKFCSKCSFKNHCKEQCKFKFSSPCRRCGGLHLSYLCTRDSEVLNTSVSNVSVLHCNYASVVKDDSVILPSFTANINHEGNRTMQGRVLVDTGSQRNFILRDLSLKMNLEVIKYGKGMIINGANIDKPIKSNIVKVPILLQGKVFCVPAIETPEIRVSINIENLNEIANTFIDKGYVLADGDLGGDCGET